MPSAGEVLDILVQRRRTRSAFDYLGQRHGVRVKYRYPRKPPIDVAGVDGVRVYVLPPPEDEGRIKRSSPTKTGKEVYEFASDFAIDDNLAAAFTRLAATSASAEGGDCHLRRSLARAERDRSLHQQRLRPRHGRRIVSASAQAAARQRAERATMIDTVSSRDEGALAGRTWRNDRSPLTAVERLQVLLRPEDRRDCGQKPCD